MNERSAQSLVTIAALAAMADGATDAAEQEEVAQVATRLGVSLDDIVLPEHVSPAMAAAQASRLLMTAESREAAYQVALAVCNADGYANTKESMFLRSLAQSLDIDPAQFDAQSASAMAAVDGIGEVGAQASGSHTADRSEQSVDDMILDQAMLTAALELLPDRLANLGILPLQLRLVHNIGQRSGQAGDGPQVKELMATLGIGVVAQVMESVVRKTLGGLAGGLLGGMLGGAAGVAAGGAVTFATTYALGHAAQQYYAQGRTISNSDLKSLFNRLKSDGAELYPRVQSRIAQLAQGNTLQSVMQSVRGA